MKSLKHLSWLVVCLAVLCFWSAPVVAQTADDDDDGASELYSDDELTQMLAPVALYPDALLSQILIAASYPFEVVEAERWISRNADLSPEAKDAALEEKDWDISVIALCRYPKILTMMADNMTWTAKLGDAFVNQQQEVMAVIQDLRDRAREAGNLESTPEQRVIVEERIIRIEPASYDYFYVPVYDPFVVYGSWWLPAPPFVFAYPGVVVTGAHIVFSPRIAIYIGGFGWSQFDWRARRTVVVPVNRHRKHPRRPHLQQETPRVPWSVDRSRRYFRKPQRSSRIDQAPMRPREVVEPSEPRAQPQDRRPAAQSPDMKNRRRPPVKQGPAMTPGKPSSPGPRIGPESDRPQGPAPRTNDRSGSPRLTPKAVPAPEGGKSTTGRIVSPGRPSQPEAPPPVKPSVSRPAQPGRDKQGLPAGGQTRPRLRGEPDPGIPPAATGK